MRAPACARRGGGKGSARWRDELFGPRGEHSNDPPFVPMTLVDDRQPCLPPFCEGVVFHLTRRTSSSLSVPARRESVEEADSRRASETAKQRVKSSDEQATAPVAGAEG
eukprot:scaffold4827_cov109-Isochrysis_galbana.AAC.8